MKIITFDVETIPDETRRDIIEPIIVEKLIIDKPELFGEFAMLDPSTKSSKAQLAEINRRMSVVPEYCRMVCLSYAINEEMPRSAVVGQATGDKKITEQDLLRAFWREIKNSDHLVGYNILNFDLQVIRARSARLGIAPTRHLWNVKPWEDTVVDVYAKRYALGSKHVAGYKLDQVAKIERIPIPEYYANHPVIESGFSGADVLEAWEKQDLESISTHCEMDVVECRELARLWGGYWMPQVFTPWGKDWDYETGAWVGERPEGW